VVVQRNSRRAFKGRIGRKIDSAKKAKPAGDPTRLRVRSVSASRRPPADGRVVAEREVRQNEVSPFYDSEFVKKAENSDAKPKHNARTNQIPRKSSTTAKKAPTKRPLSPFYDVSFVEEHEERQRKATRG
jgi:hypothetical protein